MNRSALTIFVLLLFSPFYIVLGQATVAEVDTTFENYMRSAWEEIQEAEFSDSLQNTYSKEFYYYYEENSESETGEKALAQAFMMWGNTGKSDYFKEAIQTLDYESELWRMIILPMSNIYARNEELDISDYYDLLYYLSDNLEDQKSRSEVVLALLRWRSTQEDKKNDAVELARELVEMNAEEFYVNQGLGYLHEFESLNIGQKAPDFELQTIDGEYISLSSLKGQYTILEFWATWCGPCIPEIPHLKSLYEKYRDDGFTVIGISLDRDKDTLVDFIAEKDMPWPQIYVTDGWEAELPRLFNVSGIPRMYLLDPDGVIIGRDLRGEEMVSKVENLMND